MSATPDSTLANPEQFIADLQRQLAECKAERDEALQRETATAEVLQVINSSPGDLAPVFDAILEKAHALCGAPLGSLVICDGEQLRAVATRGYPKEYEALARQGFSPTSAFRRLLSAEPFVHVPDPTTPGVSDEDLPIRRAAVEIAGIRTALFVPLRKDATVLGYISAQRQEVRPFTDKQIALLQNFAAQAVIAMENARLITETREALEQQTATAEVLQVINSSPGDLAPVFDAMLERATNLCDADFGILLTYQEGRYRAAAFRNVPPAYAALLREPIQPGAKTALARIAQGEPVAQIADIAADEELLSEPMVRGALDVAGFRTVLAVPLRAEYALLGAFTIYRREVRPFSDKQIALLQNFAAQAVIAMENARLLTETREALEQQTATAEVLQVINSSPGDLAPVFDAMLEKALHLCEADLGGLYRFDGKAIHPVAARSGSKASSEILQQSFVIEPGSSVERLVRGEDAVVQVRDIVDTEAYRSGAAYRVKFVELTGARTALWVALRKDETLIGVFVIYRQEVRPFSDKQIALLQNFAAQAVIAMENARLITETREALDQQTATAEVLGVINSSPGDLAPVFDAMLEKAMRLCEAGFGLLASFDGEAFHAAALNGVPAVFAESWREPRRPSPGLALYQLMQGEDLVHVPDVTAEDAYRSGNPIRRALADLGGARTGLWIALRKDAALLGAFVIYRQEIRPFSEKQIALLQNFAAQAVIAMENARLITETREALEQQTATAEVLQVINSSPGDLAAVFDAMLDKAMRLCDAAHGHLALYDGEVFRAGQAGASGLVQTACSLAVGRRDDGGKNHRR
jgi:GAF domain-containing protein